MWGSWPWPRNIPHGLPAVASAQQPRDRPAAARRTEAPWQRHHVLAAVSVFPEEVHQAPRSWTERAYGNLIHFNELPKGGHFAAWEQPKLFSEEVRGGFRSLRKQLTQTALEDGTARPRSSRFMQRQTRMFGQPTWLRDA